MKCLLVLFMLAVSLPAWAGGAPVWNYRLENAGPVQGGKLKLSPLAAKPGYQTWKVKYKLETSAGYKENWFPYNFPAAIFDSSFLSRLEPGRTLALPDLPHGWERRQQSFRIRKEESSFLLLFDDGQLRFWPAPRGPWGRVEFKVRQGFVTVLLKGNLEEITHE